MQGNQLKPQSRLVFAAAIFAVLAIGVLVAEWMEAEVAEEDDIRAQLRAQMQQV